MDVDNINNSNHLSSSYHDSAFEMKVNSCLPSFSSEFTNTATTVTNTCQYRVHSTFRQTSCSTGRLTSHGPNVMCIAKDFPLVAPHLYPLAQLIEQIEDHGRLKQLLLPYFKDFNNEISSKNNPLQTKSKSEQIMDQEPQLELCVLVRNAATININNSNYQNPGGTMMSKFRLGKLNRIIKNRSILDFFPIYKRKDYLTFGMNSSSNNDKIINDVKESEITLFEYWDNKKIESDGKRSVYSTKTKEELLRILQVEVIFYSNNQKVIQKKRRKKDEYNNYNNDDRSVILTYPSDEVWIIETPLIQRFLPQYVPCKSTSSKEFSSPKESQSQSLLCLRRIVSAGFGWSLLCVDYEQLEV